MNQNFKGSIFADVIYRKIPRIAFGKKYEVISRTHENTYRISEEISSSSSKMDNKMFEKICLKTIGESLEQFKNKSLKTTWIRRLRCFLWTTSPEKNNIILKTNCS